MTPARKKRLGLIMLMVCGVALGVGLALKSLDQNIMFFFTPTEVISGKAPVNKLFRIGGMVVEGSVQRSDVSLQVRFEVTDYQAPVPVVYEGILPDLFDEGQGAVAAGRLNAQGVLEATEVLAKHDENYMPPEVAAALENSGYDHKGKPQ